jgi:hypothetical protein
MKLLSSVGLQARHVLTHGRWFTPAIMVVCLGLEIFGRRNTSDVHDAGGAIILLLLISGIAVRHRANPIPWVKTLGRFFWSIGHYADLYKLEIGPDLRGTPPIRRQLPVPYYYLVAFLTLWSGLAATIWYFWPDGWRPLIVPVTYMGYLVLLIVLWGLMFVAALGGIYFPIMLMSRLSNQPRPGEVRMSRSQITFITLYFGITVLAVWKLPIWPALAFSGLCWLGLLTYSLAPHRPGAAQMLWRRPGTTRIRSVPLPRLLFAVTSVLILFMLALVFSAAGGSVWGQHEFSFTMPMTTIMGNWLAWSVPGVLISLGVFILLGWQNDPAREHVPSLYVDGVPEDQQKELSKRLLERGWKSQFQYSSADDVRVRLVPQEKSDATEFDPKWPLAVSMQDLIDSPVFDRLRRRDEIQLRRHLLRGLERIFHETKGRSSSGGCGYWLAPHLWFVAGLTRDEVTRGEEEPTFLTEIVGPPYVDVLSPAVRRYAYRLFKATQVNLIFVEDGVNFRKLSKVFRVLFEIYDKSNGQKRAEDVQFQGLVKVKVLFHDFDIDEPFTSSKYPEPKFSPLGRLRVMHVFRDRGGEEDLIEPPFSFDSSPMPLAIA